MFYKNWIFTNFFRVLTEVTELKLKLENFTKIKTTGRVFCDVLREETDVPTLNLSIAFDQVSDGGIRFAAEVVYFMNGL